MAKVTFEYTDESGQTHQVGSASAVPKKYVQTMVAVGEPAEEQASPAAQTSVNSSERLVLPEVPKNINLPLVLGAAGVLILLKSKNFVIKCVIVAAAAFYLFLHSYDWLMKSPYIRPYEKPPAPSSNP